jgi:hypothetical protein
MLTVNQSAKHAGVSRSTIDRACKGELPGKDPLRFTTANDRKKTRLIDKSDLDAYFPNPAETLKKTNSEPNQNDLRNNLEMEIVQLKTALVGKDELIAEKTKMTEYLMSQIAKLEQQISEQREADRLKEDARRKSLFGRLFGS